MVCFATQWKLSFKIRLQGSGRSAVLLGHGIRTLVLLCVSLCIWPILLCTDPLNVQSVRCMHSTAGLIERKGHVPPSTMNLPPLCHHLVPPMTWRVFITSLPLNTLIRYTMALSQEVVRWGRHHGPTMEVGCGLSRKITILQLCALDWEVDAKNSGNTRELIWTVLCFHTRKSFDERQSSIRSRRDRKQIPLTMVKLHLIAVCVFGGAWRIRDLKPSLTTLAK